ncbi:unnamed protein product, partial [Sphacelaria rigidula]
LWNRDTDLVLRDLVLRSESIDWARIASTIEWDTGKNSAQECQRRWEAVKDTPVKGPWSAEEDEHLKRLVDHFGYKKWNLLAKSFPGRSGKQCRERWHNHVDARVKKGEWTPEEDQILCEAQRQLGNKWSEMSRILTGRSENAIKNRFNSLNAKGLTETRANELLARATAVPPEVLSHANTGGHGGRGDSGGVTDRSTIKPTAYRLDSSCHRHSYIDDNNSARNNNGYDNNDDGNSSHYNGYNVAAAYDGEDDDEDDEEEQDDGRGSAEINEGRSQGTRTTRPTTNGTGSDPAVVLAASESASVSACWRGGGSGALQALMVAATSERVACELGDRTESSEGGDKRDLGDCRDVGGYVGEELQQQRVCGGAGGGGGSGEGRGTKRELSEGDVSNAEAGMSILAQAAGILELESERRLANSATAHNSNDTSNSLDHHGYYHHHHNINPSNRSSASTAAAATAAVHLGGGGSRSSAYVCNVVDHGSTPPGSASPPPDSSAPGGAGVAAGIGEGGAVGFGGGGGGGGATSGVWNSHPSPATDAGGSAFGASRGGADDGLQYGVEGEVGAPPGWSNEARSSRPGWYSGPGGAYQRGLGSVPGPWRPYWKGRDGFAMGKEEA